MGRTIRNNLSGTPPQPSSPSDRTITNSADVTRTWPDEDTDLDEGVRRQMRRFQAQIQFVGEPFTPAAGVRAQVIAIEVADANGVRIEDSDVAGVRVDVFSGTATNRRIRTLDGKVVGAVGASISAPIVDGQVLVVVEADSTGTFTTGLTDSGGTGLNVSDTALTTFS